MENKNIIQENELESVSGGWEYANGPFVNYGSYIVYTVVSGDVLSGIAYRFGVTVAEIAQCNGIANPDVIRVGQRLTIYARVIR